MILQQNLAYAGLINCALDLAKTMLINTNTLYPFAVLSLDNNVHCIFTHDFDEEPQIGMIEELERQLSYRRLCAEEAVGMLVYAATIADAKGKPLDALVFNINDSSGKNTITVYPYIHDSFGFRLQRPFTCDFSD